MGQHRDAAYPTRACPGAESPRRCRLALRQRPGRIQRWRPRRMEAILDGPPPGLYDLHGMPAVRAEGAECRDPVPALRRGLSVAAAPAVRARHRTRPAAAGAGRGRRPGLAIALVTVIVPRLGSKAAAPARHAPRGQAAMTLSATGGGAARFRCPRAFRRASSPTSLHRARSRGAVVPACALARTWVNVRGARGRAAPSVRVLNPGDVVQVDSLSRGWYRVLIDGRAAGYVHRSNLDPVPPPR